MKKAIAIIMAALLAVALLGCSAQTDENTADGKTVTVELEENPSTGYAWSYTANTEGILKEVGNEFVSENDDEDVTGAPGTRVYTFEAEGDGTVTLTFVYKQDWEGGEQAQSYVASYKVENGVAELLTSETIDASEQTEETTEAAEASEKSDFTINVLVDSALKADFDEVINEYTGINESFYITYDTSENIAKLVEDGTDADIVLCDNDTINKLIADGKVYESGLIEYSEGYSSARVANDDDAAGRTPEPESAEEAAQNFLNYLQNEGIANDSENK